MSQFSIGRMNHAVARVSARDGEIDSTRTVTLLRLCPALLLSSGHEIPRNTPGFPREMEGFFLSQVHLFWSNESADWVFPARHANRRYAACDSPLFPRASTLVATSHHLTKKSKNAPRGFPRKMGGFVSCLSFLLVEQNNAVARVSTRDGESTLHCCL